MALKYLKWWKWQIGAPVRWVPPSFQFGNFFLFVDKLYTYWRCAYFMDINFWIFMKEIQTVECTCHFMGRTLHIRASFVHITHMWNNCDNITLIMIFNRTRGDGLDERHRLWTLYLAPFTVISTALLLVSIIIWGLTLPHPIPPKKKLTQAQELGYIYCTVTVHTKDKEKTWFDVILIALCWFLLIFLGLTIWLFSEYIISLLRDGLESSNVENLVIAFLFARQCCLEGPHVFATYPDWYQVDNNSYVYAIHVIKLLIKLAFIWKSNEIIWC